MLLYPKPCSFDARIHVHKRTIFKVLLLKFKALNGLAPPYIANLLEKYVPTRTLRSASGRYLQSPTSNSKTYDDRAFSICAPRLWNNLPDKDSPLTYYYIIYHSKERETDSLLDQLRSASKF